MNTIDIVDAYQLAPPIAFSTEDDTPAPVPTQDFLTALRAFLLAIPGLEELTDAYWEDTPPGVQAGVAAGMTVFGFCAHTPEHKLREAGAQLTFDDLRRLPDLLPT
jgi:beta-phosphoglucomutase-like phosphatase (HAD superfamily)